MGSTASVGYLSSLDSESLSNYVDKIGDDFQVYRAIIMKNKLNGASLSSFQELNSLMQFLENLGVTNRFHCKILSLNILALQDVRQQEQHPADSNDGLKLSSMLDFIEECGGSSTLEGLTTTEFNVKYMKPFTFHRKASYCDVIKAGSNGCVAKAQAFVIHTWSYKFLDVVSVLKHHFIDQPDIIVWFDIFSYNQHSSPILDFNTWNHNFHHTISECNRTVLVLSPCTNPIPLTRIWCLYEMYHTAESKRNFEIGMNSNDEKMLENSIKTYGKEAVHHILQSIDTKKSECTIENDKQLIFQFIENTIGFEKINTIIFDLLRDWMISYSQKLLLNHNELLLNELEIATIEFFLGNLFNGKGMYQETELYYKKALEKREKELSLYHKQTLIIMNSLGLLYISMFQYEEALNILQKTMELSMEVLGKNHKETLSAISHLSTLYMSMGQYDDALPLFMKCVSINQVLYGERHANTLSAMNTLASLYLTETNYEQAEILLQKCYNIKAEDFGENHLDTVTAIGNLASLYESMGRLEEALLLHEKYYEKQLLVRGETHPDTLRCMNNLAIFYINMNKMEDALQLYKKNLDISLSLFGANHPGTQTSMNNLANIYESTKRYEEALPLRIECLELRRSYLGERRPNTVSAMSNLAVLYEYMERYEDALELFNKCFEIRMEIFGETHPDTVHSKEKISSIKKKLQKTEMQV